MTTDDMEIVSAVKAKLADRVGLQRFEVWFGNQTRLSLGNEVLRVSAAGEFYQNWLRKNFRRDIELAAEEVLGIRPTVQFDVDESLSDVPAEQPAKEQPSEPPESAENNGKRPRRAPLREKKRRRRPLASFDQYVVGAGNKLAVTSAQLASQGQAGAFPLVLCGPTGVGKTHLLEAICAVAREGDGRTSAVCITAEQFTIDFLEALNGKGLPSFRRRYRGVDLLLIDDIQFLARKRATLGELLCTLDALARGGRQVVLAADQPPAQIKGLGQELAARLSGGLVCRIEAADYSTRIGIVAELAARREIEVPDKVCQLIAAHVSSHAWELAGALNHLHATSVALGEPIGPTLAETAMAQFASHANRPVRLPDIHRAVCDVFGIEPESLKSKRKGKSVSHPRMLAMFLARKHTRAALSEIGAYFGRRTHSTVISANRKVERWMATGEHLTLDNQTLQVEDALRKVEDRLRAG